MFYQWRQGRSHRQIRDSLGMLRKTIRKHLGRLRRKGPSRDGPLPPRDELAALVASCEEPAAYRRPGQEPLDAHWEEIKQWLKRYR